MIQYLHAFLRTWCHARVAEYVGSYPHVGLEVLCCRELISVMQITCAHTFPTHAYMSKVAFFFSLHDDVFIPTIQGQGTEEQKEKWLTLGNDYKIIGTYAQTELGHGNV